jgi:hypothetical protein
VTGRTASRFLVSLSLLLLACVSSGPAPMGTVPVNMRTFPMPYKAVWKAVTETVQYDFLIPIEVMEAKQGYFSSELIKDYQPQQRSKYRVSGTVMFDGSGTVVKLYKQLEIEQGDSWITIPSDLTLEMKILDAVGKKLRAK